MKHFYLSIYAFMSLVLISWGSIGHRTVASIADKHLSHEAKAAIKDLLGSESLADISTWADQIKTDPQYKYTAPWHFVDVEEGLGYGQFATEIRQQGENNLHGAIIRCRHDLISGTRVEKIMALKFLVHLVGDAHQPMHVSHKLDKGGNNIQVRFDGRGANLHSLWDTKLIDHERSAYGELANEYDTATPQQINAWQNEDYMKWLWESYVISSKLYEEVKVNRQLGDEYYTDHIGIVRNRIDMAGIRLAYVLNECFKSGSYTASSPAYKDKNDKSISLEVRLEDLANHVGEHITVSSKVTGIKVLRNMALLNMGGHYPNQLLTIVLKGDLMKQAKELDNQLLTVTGQLILYKGKPEILVTDPELYRVR